MLRLILLTLAFAAAHAQAVVTSAVPLTPPRVGVLGNETREFSARFFDAAGQPAANESVQFLNDACGNFANGSPVITVKTDATGTASAPFTARNQGITCWLIATAGAVQVRWDVLTFTLGQVHFTTSMTPSQPRPGERYVVNVNPMAGAYRIYEADVSAKVIAGTAGATVSPAVGSSGQLGIATFDFAPDARVGDYEIELQYRGHVERIAMRAPDAPWQDLWWGGVAENGWGISIIQHRDVLFTVIYAYDAAGKPTWYVLPDGSWNAARTAFSGALYSPRGAPFTNYDAAKLVVGAPVGSMTLTIVDGSNLVLDYVIGGVTGRKYITRQNF